MKKLIVLIQLIVLLSVTFVPVMAKGPSGNQLYAIAGYIRAIDATNKTITVEVMVGNRLGDDYLNEEVDNPDLCHGHYDSRCHIPAHPHPALRRHGHCFQRSESWRLS